MATQPQRRQSDRRPPRPVAFGPTPGEWGAPDPEGFSRSLTIALDASRRFRRPLTLVVLEIGEPGGEPALVQVADLVRRTVRGTDGVWRTGPSTLMVLLADADGPSAEPALARIRMRLKAETEVPVRMGRAAAPPGVAADVLAELARTDLRPLSSRSH
jgi:GGDEF domain-containing protein